MLAPDTILQNRYQIVRLLAKGGMGAVYLAKDQRLKINIALKETYFTDKLMRRAFEREANILANLQHPALIRVTDHFTEGEGQFLVMEFVPGDDLGAVLSKRKNNVEPKGEPKPFPVKDALNWADQLLDALAYLHKRQPPIVHRDIKPENLKLTARGQIMLLDFGLAKGIPLKTSRKISWGSLFGFTLSYAPLEQMQGTGTDPRSDLYSLAATLYHLMTGAAPVDAMKRATRTISGEPDPLLPADEIHSQVPPAIAAILMQAMALERDQRINNADAMRKALLNANRSVVDKSEKVIPSTVEIGSERPANQILDSEMSSLKQQDARSARTGSPVVAITSDPQAGVLSPPDNQFPAPATISENAPAKSAQQKSFITARLDEEPQFAGIPDLRPRPETKSRAYMLWAALGGVIVIIALVTAVIWALRSIQDSPQVTAPETVEKTVPTPVESSSDPRVPPAPVMVEALNYYLETESANGRAMRAMEWDSVDRDQRFRLRFKPVKTGYLYIIAPGEGDTPTLFLSARAIKGGRNFQFPVGNNWIRVRSESSDIKFTAIFSQTPFKKPHFLASQVGRKLEMTEQRELQALATGAKTEAGENQAIIKVPDTTESEPLVFDIIISLR